jgi:hypothetical protein
LRQLRIYTAFALLRCNMNFAMHHGVNRNGIQLGAKPIQGEPKF